MKDLGPEDLPVPTRPEDWAKIVRRNAGKSLSEEGLDPKTFRESVDPSYPYGDDADWERAAKRVGASLESRVAWLLKLPHWRIAGHTDDAELKRELAAFIGDRQIVFPSLNGLLRQISLVRGILSNGGKWRGYIKLGYEFSLSKNRGMEIRPIPNQAAYPQLISKISETLMQAKRLLRVCASPGCRKLFIRHKRQKYCTKNCGAKVRLKKHREIRKVNLAVQQYRQPE
jgi:hypothetical protein